MNTQMNGGVGMTSAGEQLVHIDNTANTLITEENPNAIITQNRLEGVHK